MLKEDFDMNARRGVCYQKRVEEINAIYDRWVKRGLSNREIWRRFVYPRYGLCERAFYNILKAPVLKNCSLPDDCKQLMIMFDDV